MEKEILVYVDIDGVPRQAGRLWARVRKGKETATFEYDAGWLKTPERFALEPALGLDPGPFHVTAGKALFGVMGDSAPDRWGRMLMRRAERRRAGSSNEAPHTLLEIDYLLGVDDEARQGALRFAEKEGGPFLAESIPGQIPPLLALPRLLSAAERMAGNAGDDEDLRLLLAPGSSLGGARPKASVRDRDGHLAIAKFSRKDDEFDQVLWEGVALTLAGQAGITVPEWRLENVAGKPVLLSRRFDRSDGMRLPFLSAMSMLGAGDFETRSYPEIADALRRFGAAPKEDMGELWRRIAFNVLVSNTDDHLRNHGFLYAAPDGWRMSPAYDLNPMPADIKPRILTTAITHDDNTASLELALETAEYFGLKPGTARTIAARVGQAVSEWRKAASKLGLKPGEMDRMASAFEHEDLRKARTGGV